MGPCIGSMLPVYALRNFGEAASSADQDLEIGTTPGLKAMWNDVIIQLNLPIPQFSRVLRV